MAFRGLVWCRTVLPCPVWKCKAWLFEVWYGVAVWSPVQLGQVLLGSVGFGNGNSWRGKVLSGRAQRGEVLYGRVKRSSVRLGKVFRGILMFSGVELCFVLHGKELSWQGGVEKSEVHYSKVWCFVMGRI